MMGRLFPGIAFVSVLLSLLCGVARADKIPVQLANLVGLDSSEIPLKLRHIVSLVKSSEHYEITEDTSKLHLFLEFKEITVEGTSALVGTVELRPGNQGLGIFLRSRLTATGLQGTGAGELAEVNATKALVENLLTDGQLVQILQETFRTTRGTSFDELAANIQRAFQKNDG